jgi:hypothetical protein
MDLRVPVGVLFVMMGVLLGGYGLLMQAKAPADLGVNVNAVWGAVMTVFGALMWLGARLGRKRRS